MNSNLVGNLTFSKRPMTHSGDSKWGNTFLEESNDLSVLYTKYVMESVGGTVRKGKTIHCH